MNEKKTPTLVAKSERTPSNSIKKRKEMPEPGGFSCAESTEAVCSGFCNSEKTTIPIMLPHGSGNTELSQIY